MHILPHGRHPCLKLMAIVSITIPDFHRIDYAPAGRTYKATAFRR